MPILPIPSSGKALSFDFATAPRIVFECGAAAQLRAICAGFGRGVLAVTGRDTVRARKFLEAEFFSISGEPKLADVRRGAQAAVALGVEVVVGFGGGSAIDAAKAIAMLAANSGEPLDYLEAIGKGQSFAHPPLPVVAVPTTAGTGAEVTRNAVLGSPEHRVKASLRSPLLVPKVALIDPELTLSMPPGVTANSGIDALTQLLEAFVSSKANAFTDEVCRRGLPIAGSALPAVMRDGSDIQARQAMSLAAMLSGIALTNAGLGIVHGFAAAAGGMLDAPHGAICASLLRAAVAINCRHSPKVAEALELIGTPLGELVRGPKLAGLGLRQEQIPELIEKAGKANSAKANPVALSRDELLEIVQLSF